jgi:catechol 2,3-dioxygenase-like lactoylglutathione lyase family enzyme
MEMRLELIPLPVSDVERALAFYVDSVGFRLDHDHRVNDSLRFIQLTPPGSACSLTLGEGIATDMAPGSLKGLQLVVGDIGQVHDELEARDVPVSGIEDLPWGRFVYFSDPDGNSWAVQEVPPRG